MPFFIIASMADIQSFGAPASSTGAPEEKTCAKSGCHDDNSVNTGSADPIINFGNGQENYVPGETYTINVSITDDNINRFGYQLVALLDSDNSNAGDMKSVDKTRTQVIANSTELQDRQYATYTFKGTEAVQTGETNWELQWTAPDTNSGEITFYAGFVSANDDYTDKGDFVYTKTLTITPSTANSINKVKDYRTSFEIYPNPVSETLNIYMISEGTSALSIKLHDANGKLVKEIYHGSIVGEYSRSFDISQLCTKGLYFLTFQNGSQIVTRKLLVN